MWSDSSPTTASTRGNPLTRPAFRLLAAFVLALLFLGQGVTAPFQKDDEARPASITVDIVSHRHWLVPVDLYQEATRKPPLFYWLSAALAEARGGIVDEPGARAVSLVAAAVTAVMVLEVASAHFGMVAGWLAYLFVIGSYGFAARAAFGRTDMLFSTLVFAAYCVLYPLAEGKDSASRAIGAGALLGLAILTKGPLALILCAIGIATYFVLMGRNPLGLALQRRFWTVLIVAVTIAAAWYVPAFIRDPTLIRVQFIEENVGHFLPAHYGGTGEATRPIYHIVMRFLGATLPLNLFLPAVVPLALRRRKFGGMLLYQVALFLAMLTFFTIASSKRDDYILYAIPPFALAIAAPFAAAADDPASGSASAWLADSASAVAAMALLLLAGAGFTGLADPQALLRLADRMRSNDASYLRDLVAAVRDHAPRIGATLIAITIASAAAVYSAVKRRTRAAGMSIALANLAVLSLWLAFLMPASARERTLKDFVLRSKAAIGDREVAIADVRSYEMSFYLGREVHIWPPPFAADERPRNAAFMFVWRRDLDRLQVKLPHNSPVLVSDSLPGRGRIVLLSLLSPHPAAPPAAGPIAKPPAPF